MTSPDTAEDISRAARHLRHSHRLRLALFAGCAAVATIATQAVIAPPASATVAASAVSSTTSNAPVTNLAHLDFLLDSVPLVPNVPGHETYHQATTPTAQALWVYANRNDDGSFTRVGGGDVTNAAKGYYAQGAFDADDIARAVVVYVRDWQQTRSEVSRHHAYGLLRDLTYLQTSSGPDAGNVVLWQQSDGSLNATPTPPDSPNPSDTSDSFWLARTIWALGESYPVFSASDPAFASFLKDRLELAIGALNRESLSHYGAWQIANGARVAAWLISDSTGASAEATLGLAAYLKADPGSSIVRDALSEEAEGIAAMASGGAQQWPYGAFLATTTSRSTWNAWAGMAPAALSNAAVALNRSDWQLTAEAATAQFMAQVLTTGGPDNAWTPTPFDRTQIAYGADSLVESLVTVGDNTGKSGMLALASIAAGWFFGANPANTPVYAAATGVCADGISATAVVNHNCGAESTIHTELTMLALDAHPQLRGTAISLTSRSVVEGITTVEAESGRLSGRATVVTPPQTWTGSANWSGGAYVNALPGTRVSIPVTTARQSNVYPVVNRTSGPSGRTLWTAFAPHHKPAFLGSTPNGSVGGQGIAETSSALLPLSLKRTIMPGTTTITALVLGSAQLDALLLQPVVSHLRVDGPAGRDLYVSASSQPQNVHTTLATPATVRQYSSTGQPVATNTVRTGKVDIPVQPDGFTIVSAQ